MKPISATFALSAALAVALPAVAGPPPIDRGEPADADDTWTPARRVSAARAAGPIAVDGRLDDAAWVDATPTSGFWQREPHEGAAPQHDTEFRVLYDGEALYVGIRAHDTQPHEIAARLTRRDEDSASDWLGVAIDSYSDRRTAFVFMINPAGVERDIIIYDDINEDPSWNAVWEGAAAVDDRGWTAELRVPFSQLRFSDAGEQAWGLQVVRMVQRTREHTFWSPSPRDKAQLVSLFGAVDDIAGIAPSRRLELLPYALGGARIAGAADGDPFNDDVSPELGVGVDFKYGVTSSLTLSGTINPDFGQVEADPSQVNLTARETFFTEKRPFFLEGADIFRFGLSQGDGDDAVEQLFYSRRIGAPPTGSASDDAVYAAADDTTTILGAGKLSGKTRGGWSVGALTALTGQEEVKVQLESGERDEQVIEPLASYSVLRLRRDFHGGRTVAGAAATGVHRKLADTGLDSLHRQAYAGGLELSHRFADDEWTADVKLLGSHVRGSAEAIDLTQRASQRYYQRPDADHLDYDPTRTSLSGTGAMASVMKFGGKHWRYGTGFDTRTPGFEVNDLGFQFASDYLSNWAWGQYRDQEPGDAVRAWHANINLWTGRDYDLENQNNGGNVNGWLQLVNYWSASSGINVNQNRVDPNLLRGGPSVAGEPAVNGWHGVSSDFRKRVQGGIDGGWWLQPTTDSWTANASAWLTVQPMSNFDVTLSPFVSRRLDDNQYVDELENMDGTPRYLLARIDQMTAGMTLRLNYTLSPALSLQAYAQPFVSAGEYLRYKQAADTRADDYADRFDELSEADVMALEAEGFERPDFNFRELRSTIVMRWEYLPGSTLFLIWNHNRDSVQAERFELGRDLSDLAGANGEHAVLCKLTYWWGN